MAFRLSVFSTRSAPAPQPPSSSSPASPSLSPTSPSSTTSAPSIRVTHPAIPRLDLKVSEPFPSTEWPDDAQAAQRRLTHLVDAPPIWVQLLGAPWVVGKAGTKKGRVVRLISGEGVQAHDLIRLSLQLSNTHITRLTYGVWGASGAAYHLILPTLGRLSALRTLSIRHFGDAAHRTAMPPGVLVALLQALPQLEVLTLDCGSEAFRDARFLRALQDRSVRLQRLECAAYHAASAWSISLECEECWRGTGPRMLDKVKLALDRNRECRKRERRAVLRVLVVARVLIHARPEPGVDDAEVLSEGRGQRRLRGPTPARNSFLLPPRSPSPVRGSTLRPPGSPHKPRRMSLLSLPPINSPFADVNRGSASVPSSPVESHFSPASPPRHDVPSLRKSRSSFGLKAAFSKVKTLVRRTPAPALEPLPSPAPRRIDTPPPATALSPLHRLPTSVRFRIARYAADVTHLDGPRLTRLARYAADRSSLARIGGAVASAGEWGVPEAQVRDDWLACGGF